MRVCVCILRSYFQFRIIHLYIFIERLKRVCFSLSLLWILFLFAFISLSSSSFFSIFLINQKKNVKEFKRNIRVDTHLMYN